MAKEVWALRVPCSQAWSPCTAQPHGPHAGSVAAATTARTYSCFGKGLSVMWGGDWLWGGDGVRAVLGKDQFWLFSAQSLFLGSLHTWLCNSPQV